MSREKIAVPLEGTPSVVLLNSGDRMTREKAIAAGYRIADADSIKPKAEQVAAIEFEQWRTRVECLPEARERPSALAEIITTHTHVTLPVEQARAFLRGLPTEAKEEETSVLTNTNDPRAARMAEISDSMREFNRSNGNAFRPKAAPPIASIEPTRLRRLAEIRLAALNVNSASGAERRDLAYALSVQDQTGLPLAHVFGQLGIDASKIITNA